MYIPRIKWIYHHYSGKLHFITMESRKALLSSVINKLWLETIYLHYPHSFALYSSIHSVILRGKCTFTSRGKSGKPLSPNSASYTIGGWHEWMFNFKQRDRPFGSICLSGFVPPMLCTTAMLQSYVVHYQPALRTTTCIVHKGGIRIWNTFHTKVPMGNIYLFEVK